MQNFFLLSNPDYDCNNHWFLTGPETITQEEFQSLCSSLLEEAGHMAIASSRKTTRWISSNEVFEELINLLEPRGFKEIKPKECSFTRYHIGKMDTYQTYLERDKEDDPFDKEIYSYLKSAHKAICEENEKNFGTGR